jgi:hypothetical protein
MKILAKSFLMLGVCLWFTTIPAAAQRGRGAGRTSGPPSRQATRSATGSVHESASSKSQSTQHSSQAGRSMAASQALEKSPNLGPRLQTLLPAGTNVTDAAAGFKNLGQFVSAAHVSNNLGIPFDSLKQEMMAGSSLGKAIQTLKPDMPKAEVKREMKRAEVQAKADLNPQGTTERTRDRDRDQTRTEPAPQP